MKIPGIALLFLSLFLLGCSPDVAERAEELQQNVVAIAADGEEGEESGFGFITGQQGNNLYITTAEHVVAQASAIEMSFQGIRDERAATLVFADPINDVAVLRVSNPPRLTWYKNCLGSGRPGDDIGFIGSNGITRGKEIGSIRDFGLNVINCYLPTVSVGASGGPLIHESGFIGMIVSDETTTTQAVDMNTIRQLLQQEQSAYFQLNNTGFTQGATETNPGLSGLEKDVADFTAADDQGTMESYQEYLDRHKDGKFRKQAQKRIEELQKKEESITTVKQSEEESGPSPEVDREIARASNENLMEIVDKDGNRYLTKIMKDGKRWMTQNLNLQVENSWCYNNEPANCAKYGRLYTWEAAKQVCTELGNGWRLPTDEEWRAMAKQYGGSDDDASDKGKSAYDALIDVGESGFAAQLGGWRRTNGSFADVGIYGNYWSSSPRESAYAWGYAFLRSDGQLYRDFGRRVYGFAVRCVQD